MFSFQNLILFIINLAKKSLQLELKNFAKIGDLNAASKQAFSQARKKLDPIVFTLMNDTLIKEFYTDNEFATIHGFRLLSIDGSTLQLPSSRDLDDYYGKFSSKDSESLTMARISVLFDIENKLTIHGVISKYNMSEREFAVQHIENLIEINKKNCFEKNEIKDLIIFDRGYPSAYLIRMLYKNKKDFLMRCPSNFIRDVNIASMSENKDQIIDIKISNLSPEIIRNLKKNILDLDQSETFKMRVLSFELESGEKEILLTSIIDQKEYPAKEIFEFYGKRWGIEENYKFYKLIADIENFSGKSKLAVEQDFFATIFTCNISTVLMLEAQDELDEDSKNKNLKYAYKINKNIALGLLRNDLIEAFILNKDWGEFCKKIKNDMKKNKIPVRPGRKFNRYNRNRRYPINTRSGI